MPHPGPCRAAVPVVAFFLLILALPASASAQGWACESSAPRRHARPEPEDRAGHREPRRAGLQGRAGRRQLPRHAAARHRHAAERHHRPRARHRHAVGADAPARPPGSARSRSRGCRSRSRRPTSARCRGRRPIPGVGTIDIRAVAAVAAADASTATWSTCARCGPRRPGACVSGTPRLTGTSSVLGVTVLGTELPVDRITSRTINLTDSTSIDPSNLSPAPARRARRRHHAAAAGPRRAAHDLRAGRRRDRARGAGPPDHRGRAARAARARREDHARRPERPRPHGRRGDRRRRERQLRRRRRPRAGVHVAPDRADRRRCAPRARCGCSAPPTGATRAGG